MKSVEIVIEQPSRLPGWTALLSGISRRALVAALMGLMAGFPVRAQQLPTGGTVVQGGGTITQPNANTLNVNQPGQTGIYNFQTFSIGRGNTVNFNQPNSAASSLARVTGTQMSNIAGTLNAPGTVVLVNPNGIAITPTGVVNVGSFAASTLNIKDSDFLAGNYKFTGNGGSAGVSNAGRINVSDGGFAALLGGQVSNSGVISARLGKVGLGAGELITLDFAGDGFLSVAVPSSQVGKLVDPNGALITNSGKIRANGGTVMLSAATAANVLRDAVNVPGSIRANSVGTHNGKIVIGGGLGGKVNVSGKLAAKSKTGKGGDIVVTGKDIALTGAKINVSGKTGGGNINIGGGYQGQGPLQRAEYLTVDAATTIKADAKDIGNGGNVVLWSDVQTTFAGNISAKGGANGGNGGNAEVSGKKKLIYTGFTNLSATNGAFGTLLLDPHDITISNGGDSGHDASFTATADNSVINVTTLRNALNAANVTVQTGADGGQAGNITVADALTWTSATMLTLQAAGNIQFNAAVTGSDPGSSLSLSMLTGGTTISQSATGTITAGSLLLFALTSANANLNTATNSVSFVNADMKTGSLNFKNAGAFTLLDVRADAGIALTTANAGAGITQFGGATKVTTNALALTTNGGSVTLDTTNNAIAALGNVSLNGGALTLATARSGGFTLNGATTSASGGINVTNTAGDLSTTNSVASTGPITLTSSTGNVSTGGSVTSGGKVTMTAANGGITLGGSVSGQGAAAVSVALTSKNSLSVNQIINANNGVAWLNVTGAGNGITQTAAGGLQGLGLQLDALGSVNVTTGAANNNTSFLAGQSGGSFAYTDNNSSSLTIGGVVSNGIVSGGNIAVTAAQTNGQLRVSRDVTASSSNVTLQSHGNLVIGDGVTSGSGGGTITANGTTGVIALTSTAGSIAQATGGRLVGAKAAATAFNSVDLRAINNAIGTFAANATNGYVAFYNSGGIALDTVGSLNGVTASSDVVLAAFGAGNITQTANGKITTTNGGGLLLQASNGSITLDQANSVSGSFAVTGTQNGNVTLRNAGTLNVGTAGGNTPVGTFSGITLNTARNLSLTSDTGNITQSASGVITAGSLAATTSGGNTLLDTATNSVGAIGSVSLGAGRFALKTDASAGFSVPGASIIANGGIAVTNTTGNISTVGALTASNGAIVLAATGAGRGITLGGTVSGVGVTLTSDAALTIDQSINGGSGTVSLNTTGAGSAITQTAGTITAGTLAATTTNANVTLGNANNAITNLGTVSIGTGALGLVDTGGLTVTGAVNAGTVQLISSGTIAVNNTINTSSLGNAGLIWLTASGAGNITQSATGGLVTARLQLDATAGSVSATAGAANNNVTTLAGRSSDDFAYADGNTTGLLIGGIISGTPGIVSTNGNISVSATRSGAQMQVARDVTAANGNVTLLANSELFIGNNVVGSPSGAITAGGAASLTTTNAGAAITQLAGGVITAGTLALTTNGGNATFNQTSNAVTNLGAVSLGTGQLTLVDTGGLTVTGAVSALSVALTTTGTIAINNTITASGNVNSFIQLSASGAGNITQNGSGGLVAPRLVLDAANGSVDVTAGSANNNVTLIAGQSAGSFAYAETGVGSGTLTVDTVGLVGITSTSGGVSLQTRGALTLNAALNAGAGNVSLTNTDAGAAITQGAVITGNALTVSSAGAVELMSGNQVKSIGGSSNGAFNFLAASGTGLTVNGVSSSGGQIAIIDNSAGITVAGPVNSSGGNIILSTLAGTLTIDGAVTAVGAGVALQGAGGITQGAGSVITAANLIGRSLFSGSISLTGNNAVSNNVGFDAANTNGSVSFTNTSGFVVGGISSINFGFASLSISPGIRTSMGGSTTLTAGGNVTQATGATDIISTGTLILSSASDASFTLDNAGNAVTNLGTVSIGGGALTLRDGTGGLTVNGAVAAGGGISLQTPGALTLNAALNAGAGNVSLTNTDAGAAITQNSSGVITAGTLALTTNGGNATLDNTNNAVTNLGTVSLGSGALTLFDTGGLTVTGAVSAGSVYLGTTGTIAVNNTITASGIALPYIWLQAVGATSNITQNASGGLTATYLQLDAGGSVNATAGSNTVSVLAGTSGGDFAYINTGATNLTIGSVFTAGITSNTGSITVDAAGANAQLTVARDVSAASGNVTLLANGNVVVGSGTFGAGQGTVTASSGSGVITLTSTNGEVTELQGGNLIGAKLAASAATNVNLTGNNTIGSFAASAGNGTVAFFNLGSFAVDKVGAVSGVTASGNVALVILANTAGNITQTSDGIITTGGGLLLQARGSITLDQANQVAGNFALISGAQALTTDLTLRNSGNLNIGTVTAPYNGNSFSGVWISGTLSLTSDGGSITQSAGIIANTIQGSTGGGNMTLDRTDNQFGSVGPISLGAGALTLVDNSGGLTVSGAVSAGGGISLQTPGALAINNTLNGGAGTVSLTTTDTGAAITQNATGVITAGTLALATNDGNATLNTATNAVAGLGAVSLGAGGALNLKNGVNLTLTGAVNAGGGVAITNTGFIATAVGGTITTNNTEIALTATGDITVGDQVTSNGGVIALETGANGTLTVNGSLDAGAGNVFLTADNMTIAGPVSNSGSVNIATVTGNRAITLGTAAAPAGLVLDAGELNSFIGMSSFNAGKTRAGVTNAGDIQFGQSLFATGAVNLFTNAGVKQNSPIVFIGAAGDGTLNIAAVNTVDLRPGVAAGLITGSVSGANQHFIAYGGGSHINIGPITTNGGEIVAGNNNVNGTLAVVGDLISNGGNINATSIGVLTLAADIDARGTTDGSISLVSIAGINQTAGGIKGKDLIAFLCNLCLGSTTGNITLDSTTNTITGNVALFNMTGGNINFTNDSAYTVGGINGITYQSIGAITLAPYTGVTGSGIRTAGANATVTLTAGGDIVQATDASDIVETNTLVIGRIAGRDVNVTLDGYDSVNNVNINKVANLGNVSIGQGDFALYNNSDITIRGTSTVGGRYEILSDGNVTLAAGASINTSSVGGDVYLTSGCGCLGGIITLNGDINAGAGTVYLAADTITQPAGSIIADTLNVQAVNATLDSQTNAFAVVNAQIDNNFSATTSISLTVGAVGVASLNGSIALTALGATSDISIPNLTGVGGTDVTLNAGRDVLVNGSVFGNGTVSATAARDILISSCGCGGIFGNDVALDAGRNISIDAGIAAIQSARLRAGGDITDTSNAQILAVDLRAVSTGGTVTLTNGSHFVNTIAGSSSGNFSYKQNADLTIAALTPGNGITSGGGVTVDAGTGSVITIDALARVIANSEIVLAGGSFKNNRGSDAVASSAGRWLIYASAPGTAADYNGLNSNNTAIWGTTYPNTVTATGNRYVFAMTPTVTLSPDNVSKVYGQVPVLTYSATGLQPGVAGAYLADTLATATAGAPVLTSAGQAATASVAGGPYLITIALGSLTGRNGYNVNVGGTANLTVTPATLTYVADLVSREAGAPNPLFTGNVTGFVNGETLGTATMGTLAWNSLANTSSPAGRYGIFGSGLSAANYVFVQAATNATALTVTPPPTTATSQVTPPSNNTRNPGTNITYQNNPTGLANISFTTGAAPRTAAAPTDAVTAGNPDAVNRTNNGFTYQPVSLFDANQYGSFQLPAYADKASLATIFTMISRAVQTSNAADFMIDGFWTGTDATWAKGTDGKPVASRVIFSDGADKAVSPTESNGFPIEAGKTDVLAMLGKGPVILGGSGTPAAFLLAIKASDDGKGIIANDPISGRQVLLSYDAGTKTVGGVAGIFDARTQKFVALSEAAVTQQAGEPALKADSLAPLNNFVPATFFAVTVK